MQLLILKLFLFSVLSLIFGGQLKHVPPLARRARMRQWQWF